MTTQDETRQNTTQAVSPELVEVDPTTVQIGTNVRLDARLDKAFVASIKARGVLLPIRAYRNADGVIVAVDGQRRTLAAVEAGLASIPAYVSASPEDAERIVDQLAANDHRAALTAGEHAAAFEQLAGFGLSAAQIAKRTGHKRAQVDAGLAAVASEQARDALSKHVDLTIDQAAGLAEVDDNPDDVARLLDALPRGQFEHELQRIRDGRAEAQARALLTETLTAAGVAVIDRPGYDDRSHAQLSHLKGGKGGIDPDEHAQCPGHAAYIVRGYGDDPVEPVYVCTNWRKHGHQDRYASTSSKPKAADMTESEREAAKAERRDVIESNKAWKSAETVRRQWVTKFLTRKTAPKGAAAFIATSLFYNTQGLNGHGVESVAEAFTGHRGGYADATAQSAIDKATEGRATVLALGYALAAAEAATGTHSWREVNKRTASYLTFLADQGYTLSAVEERAAGVKKKRTRTAKPLADDGQGDAQ